MFKLVKIINSVSGAPECVKLPVADTDACYGDAMKLKDGKLVKAEANEYPEYVVCSKAAQGGAVTAFAVTEQMTLETLLITEEGYTANIGDRVAVTENGCVTPTESGCGIIESVCGSTVYVKFIK